MAEKDVHIVVPEQLHKRLRVVVACKGTTIKKYAADAILDAINREEF